MVMLAVEFPPVCYVARWANSAAAIGAFEAVPVVCSSIHRNLAKLQKNNSDSTMLEHK